MLNFPAEAHLEDNAMFMVCRGDEATIASAMGKPINIITSLLSCMERDENIRTMVLTAAEAYKVHKTVKDFLSSDDKPEND